MPAPAALRDRHAGLYLHIPFCSAICPYCDFAVTLGGAERRARFVSHLVTEVEMWRGVPLAFDTVYFGGGTPSALAPREIETILDAVRGSLDVAADAWLFLEANPEDVTVESVAAWRGLGVRTLSLGVQSFDARALQFLGRRHSAETARRSVLLAREAGFHTVSLDLIYGLLGETPEAFRRSLDAAISLAPDHLSCYQLTIHDGTLFGVRAARGELAELPEPEQADLFAFTHAYLADHGYPAYEISNFARGADHRSRHNRKYWDHTPYLGLGPSAHSLIAARRFWNERRLAAYEKRVAGGEKPIADGEDLSRVQLALEALMLGLRTTDGVDLGRFRERYGVDLLAGNGSLVERLVREGFVALSGSALAPTRRGLAVADALARGFAIDGDAGDVGGIGDKGA
ncbi:MAG TPA: radical SAM family heme chaperone HemW [Thermoanaerobaculia bacterium]